MFGQNWLSVSGEEDENVKSLRQRQRDEQQTHFYQNCSLEPTAFGAPEHEIILC